MKALLTAGVAVSLALVAGTWIGQAQEPSQPVPFLRTDVNGNGVVNSVDLFLVAVDFGKTAPPNRCVEWITDDPPYALVNLHGEYKTPNGGEWAIPSDHPAIEAFRQGTPIPMWPCLD